MQYNPIVYKTPMTFPKLNTLYKRDPEITVKKKGVIMPGYFSEEVFKTIKYWTVTEKIHGKNIRIYIEFPLGNLNHPTVWIGGRKDTDTPQINKPLLNHIHSILTDKKMLKAFTKDSFKTFECPRHAMIFGEGVGKGINQAYGDEPELIIFDIVIDNWWLEYKNVQDISEKLGFRSAPLIAGAMSTERIIDYVKAQKDSLLATKPYMAEGVIATSHPLLLTRKCEPVRFKLKTKDYRDLEAIKKAKKWK